MNRPQNNLTEKPFSLLRICLVYAWLIKFMILVTIILTCIVFWGSVVLERAYVKHSSSYFILLSPSNLLGLEGSLGHWGGIGQQLQPEWQMTANVGPIATEKAISKSNQFCTTSSDKQKGQQYIDRTNQDEILLF